MAIRAGCVGVILALGASSAWAGDTACLWGKLPAADRDKVVADYAAKGIDGAMKAGIEITHVVIAASECTKVPEDKAGQDALIRVIEQVFFGASLEQGAAAALTKARGLSQADLDAAWGRLSATDRAGVMTAVGGGTLPFESVQAMMVSATAAGWTPDPKAASPVEDPAFLPFRDYFFGRTLREAAAAGF